MVAFDHQIINFCLVVVVTPVGRDTPGQKGAIPLFLARKPEKKMMASSLDHDANHAIESPPNVGNHPPTQTPPVGG